MISIVVCTYNPDFYIFSQCLEALQKAVQRLADYEIIIVDNNSTNQFDKQSFFEKLLMNDNVIIVRELSQGLTPARLRGFVEAKYDLICYIDDDNFIDENYFVKGLEISNEFKFIGAWSGQVDLVFETEPEPWTRRYFGMLVFRKFDTDKWSNLVNISDTMPCGAGLFVRKSVLDYYNQLHVSRKREIQLDRSGNSLFSGGDDDLASCACDIGLGVGLFHELKLNHYIPSKRLSKEYLLRLAEGIAASSIILRSFRQEVQQDTRLKKKIKTGIQFLFMNSLQRQFQRAVLRGEKKGYEILANKGISHF